MLLNVTSLLHTDVQFSDQVSKMFIVFRSQFLLCCCYIFTLRVTRLSLWAALRKQRFSVRDIF